MNNYQTKFLIKAAICLWIASLVACGGGGGGGGVVDAVTNKWTTNAGIYSACDSHSKISVTLAPVGINQMSLSFKQDVFALDNCSGAIVGSVSPWSLTFTYLSTIVASVSGIGSGTAVQSLGGLKSKAQHLVLGKVPECKPSRFTFNYSLRNA